MKRADDFVGHDVFGDVATPRRPSTALSELKRHEMIGQNIFADGQDEGYRKNTVGEMQFSDARAAAVAGMTGSDIFSDGDGAGWRAAVQVTRPPGGGPSNVTLRAAAVYPRRFSRRPTRCVISGVISIVFDNQVTAHNLEHH